MVSPEFPRIPMKIFVLSILAWSLCLVNGCEPKPNHHSDRQIETRALPLSPVIRIEDLTVTEKDLRLTYHVENPSDGEMWVCEDVFPRYPDDHRQDVRTRIIGDTLWIKLCYRHGRGVFPEWGACARYDRMAAGGSRSGTISLELPVADASPVEHFYGPRIPVVAHCIVFEVGYFEGDLFARLVSPVTNELPLMLQPLQRHYDANTVFVPYFWPGLDEERVVDTSIPNVDVPCRGLAEGTAD
jgi:hypothetical protein